MNCVRTRVSSIHITKHAKQRIAERNIPTAQLVQCLTEGKYYENKWDANKITCIHTGINLYIVMDKDKTTVISVFRKES